MKRADRDAWADALESGEYVQGTGALKRLENGVFTHCCLGVACEVFGVPSREKETQREVFEFEDKKGESGWVQGWLPSSLQVRLGLDREGIPDGDIGNNKSLVYLNDNQHTFEYIARVIRNLPVED